MKEKKVNKELIEEIIAHEETKIEASKYLSRIAELQIICAGIRIKEMEGRLNKE